MEVTRQNALGNCAVLMPNFEHTIEYIQIGSEFAPPAILMKNTPPL